MLETQPEKPIPAVAPSWTGLPRQAAERVRRFSPPVAALSAGVLAWVMSNLFYARALWMPLRSPTMATRYDDFIKMCGNPFARGLSEPIVAYRVTAPTIAWLMGLRGASGLLVQYAAIIAMLAVTFHAMAKRTDRRLALLVTLGIAGTFAVVWPNTKPGFPDSVTHLATAIALAWSSPVVALAMTVCGALNDERFALAIPFILLWHAWSCASLSEVLKSSWRRGLGFLGGAAIVLLVRHALTVGWIGPGIEPLRVYDLVGGSLTRFFDPLAGWREYLINVVMAFRWLWFMVLIAPLASPIRGARLWLYYLGLALVIRCSASVYDVSRAITFDFPAVMLAVAWLASTQRERAVRWSLVCVVLLYLTPLFYVQNGPSTFDIQLLRPLPLSLLRMWTGWDVMDLLRAHHP
jgi:hypothetical protein